MKYRLVTNGINTNSSSPTLYLICTEKYIGFMEIYGKEVMTSMDINSANTNIYIDVRLPKKSDKYKFWYINMGLSVSLATAKKFTKINKYFWRITERQKFIITQYLKHRAL